MGTLVKPAWLLIAFSQLLAAQPGRLSVGSVELPQGGEPRHLFVVMDNPETVVGGSGGIRFDPRVVVADGVDLVGTVLRELNNGVGPALFQFNIVDDGLAYGFIVTFGINGAAPGFDQPIIRIRLRAPVEAEMGASSALEFSETVLTNPVRNILVGVEANDIEVELDDGSALVIEQQPVVPVDVLEIRSTAPGTDFAFGEAVLATELDGDGVPDIVVGEPGVGDGRGSVLEYFGPDFKRKLLRAPDGLLPGDRFGASLARTDLDGDGEIELAVGAPNSNNSIGKVWIYSAANGWNSVGIPLSLAFFGSQIVAGDIDGDGLGEFLVTSPGRVGALWVISEGLEVEKLVLPDGVTSANRIAVGNIDGDAALDIALSFPSGFALMLSSDEDRVYLGPPFPVSVAILDTDGDGLGELAVGNEVSGRVFLYRGPDFGVPVELPAPDGVLGFGRNLAVGNPNADFLQELLVGGNTSIHLYQGAGLQELHHLGSGGPGFASSMSISPVGSRGRTVIAVGAPGDDAGSVPEAGNVALLLFGYSRNGYLRGDCDGNSRIALPDAIFHLLQLFADVPPTDCPASCDTDGNGIATLADTILLLRFLFVAQNPLPPPFPNCGPSDETPVIECLEGTCPE